MICAHEFLLDNVCEQVEILSHLSKKKKKRRQKIVKLIDDLIRKNYENAKISLFGSSQNGFGMKTSDLDLCLTFEGIEKLNRESQTNVIKEIGSFFKQNSREFGGIEINNCKERSPQRESPQERSPQWESLREKSSDRESLQNRSPQEGSPRVRSREVESLIESLREDYPPERSSEWESLLDEISVWESPHNRSPQEGSPQRKSRRVISSDWGSPERRLSRRRSPRRRSPRWRSSRWRSPRERSSGWRLPRERSLSSFAYNIMVIHYLMNTSVPVLPCLQEIYVHEYGFEQENTLIDGYDCYFYKKISMLPRVWNYYKENTDSAGSLWLGFLRYYTEVFDWHNDVVTIRTTEKITKNKKKWSNSNLAIEDPFKINKNLAGSIKDDDIIKELHNLKIIYTYPLVQSNQVINQYFGREKIDAEDIEMSKDKHLFRRCTISNKREMIKDKSYRTTGIIRYYKPKKDEIIQLKKTSSIECFDSCAENQKPISDQNNCISNESINNGFWFLGIGIDMMVLICIFSIFVLGIYSMYKTTLHLLYQCYKIIY